MKKKYEHPMTAVIRLEERSPLLTLSNPGNYSDGGDPLSGSRELEDFESLGF